MSEFKTKLEWETAADTMYKEGLSPQEINKKIGQYTGEEGTFTIQQAKSSKRGFTVVDKNKRGVRNAKRVKMERDQSMGIGDTVEPRGTTDASLRRELGAGKGQEIHHRNSLIQNTPFMDGLTEAETREFVTWANKQGWKLGNQPGNPEIVITKKQHTDAHAWLRNNEIEGARGPQKRLTQRFSGMSMDDRKYAFRNYMAYVQGGADEMMAQQLGDVSKSPTHDAAQKKNLEFVKRDNELSRLKYQIGEVPSGPRKGQPLPVNRRTLGDAIIKDLRMQSGVAKFGAVIPWLDYLPGLDQATGGHIERTIDRGVNVVRQAVGQEPNPLDAPDPEGPVMKFANGVAKQVFNFGATLFKTNAKYPE